MSESPLPDIIDTIEACSEDLPQIEKAITIYDQLYSRELRQGFAAVGAIVGGIGGMWLSHWIQDPIMKDAAAITGLGSFFIGVALGKMEESTLQKISDMQDSMDRLRERLKKSLTSSPALVKSL